MFQNAIALSTISLVDKARNIVEDASIMIAI